MTTEHSKTTLRHNSEDQDMQTDIFTAMKISALRTENCLQTHPYVFKYLTARSQNYKTDEETRRNYKPFYKQPMGQSPSWDDDNFSGSQIPRHLRNPSPPWIPIPSHTNPVDNLPNYSFKIHFNTILIYSLPCSLGTDTRPYEPDETGPPSPTLIPQDTRDCVSKTEREYRMNSELCIGFVSHLWKVEGHSDNQIHQGSKDTAFYTILATDVSVQWPLWP
jgi:hypothetical protein